MDAEGDGYVSPEFDLPSASESEHDDAPPQKRQKPSKKTREDSDLRESWPMALIDEEALALTLLRGREKGRAGGASRAAVLSWLP